MADGTIKILTDLDTAGIKKGLSNLGSTVKSGVSGITKTISGISAAIGGISLGTIVKYNAQMEQYQTSFTTMLGSASKAQSMIANLKDFADKTPFEMSDLSKGAQTLLAFGTSANDIMPDLKMLGDISQGDKAKFDGLTLAFAQISSAGKLSGQDLLQCINVGFNPLNEISKKTGESMADLRKRMESGGISAQEVAEAFKSATSEGGQFYGAMEAQSKTFNGQLSTLKDNAMTFLGDVSQGMQSTLKDDLLPTASGWVSQLSAAFKRGGTTELMPAIGDVLAQAIAKAAGFAPQFLQTGTMVLVSFIKGLTSNSDTITASAISIGQSIVSALTTVIPAVGKAGLDMITAFARQLFGYDIGRDVAQVGNTIKSGFSQIAASVQSALPGLGVTVKNVIADICKIVNALLPVVSGAVSFLAGNINNLLPLITSVGVGFKTWSAIKGTTKDLSSAGKAVSGFVSVVAKIKDAAKMWDTFSKAQDAAAISTYATSGKMTIMQGIVGILTGKITLATAATAAWDAACAALGGPLGVVITLIAAVGAGIAIYSATQQKAASSADLLADSQDKLGEAYSGVAKYMKDYQTGVDSATSSMDGFNDAIIMSSDKQAELSNEMTSVQQQISQIAADYSAKRIDANSAEVKSLDDLFAKMQSITDQYLSFYQAKAGVVKGQAESLRDDFEGTADEYEAASQRTQKAAEDEYNNTVKYAQDQTTNILASKQQLIGTAPQYTQEWYDQEAKAAYANEQTQISTANDTKNATLSALSDGYAKKASAAQDWLNKQVAINQQEEQENQTHTNNINDINAKFNDYKQAWLDIGLDQETAGTYALEQIDREKEKENTRHNNVLTDLNSQLSSDLDSETKKQLGTLTQMVANSGGEFSKMDSSAQKMVDSFLLSLTKLPPGAQDTVNQALEGMGLKIDDGVGLMYTGGDKDGQAFIKGWSSKDAEARNATANTVSQMNDESSNSTIDAPTMNPITNGDQVGKDGVNDVDNTTSNSSVSPPSLNDMDENNTYSVAMKTYNWLQGFFNSHTITANMSISGGGSGFGDGGGGARWAGGYFANGGVTGYANGGYQISKHADGAVGVFTHRTRLWDPVTGVNEYGEKGHEALLPLKQSVYNEIAKGIVRQLSPAKLSGVITAMRESVRSESANTSAAVVGTANYYRSPYSTSSNTAPSTASNDTFNFYEPVPTPQAHARALKRAKRELAYD
ncbi:MAG: tape measure protein [Clostridiales bacterium]|nr:tape measure protein [Clostridiales bacterium]MCI1961362.1 tape measure protein [Clostridiales bacterium]MCI2021803.1 tape measure protein [Clostridiales bacterium]MCI2026590.1 tape measure protein [Clostridiales bacterium]